MGKLTAEEIREKRRSLPHLFKKGVSGNPAGRPKGSKSYGNMLAREMLDRAANSILAKVIEKALDGNEQCLKMCMDRLLPSQRSVDISKIEQKEQAINIFVENMSPKAIEGTIIDVLPIEKPVLKLIKD